MWNANGTNYTHQLLWTRLLTTALERHQAILSNEVYICRKDKFSSKGLDDVYMRPKIKFPLAMKKSLFTSLFIAVVGMKGLIKNVNKPERYIEASWHQYRYLLKSFFVELTQQQIKTQNF